MDVAKLIKSAQDCEYYWKELSLPVDVLVDFLVRDLHQFSPKDYCVFDFFQKETVQKIVDRSIAYINAKRNGIEIWSIGEGGGQVDTEAYRPKLERILSEWSHMGWITLPKDCGF